MSTAAAGNKKNGGKQAGAMEIWLQRKVAGPAADCLQFLTFVGHARMLHLILRPIPRRLFPGKTCPAFGPGIILCQWQTCAKLLHRNLLTVKIWECLWGWKCVFVCVTWSEGKSCKCHKFPRENLNGCVLVCVRAGVGMLLTFQL